MFCYCVPLCLCDDWTDVWVSCSAQSPIVWVWPMQGPELRNSFPVINTKTGSGCSKYVKCFSHAPIVWCSAFWNVKLLFCNDFALLAIATTHQSYSLKFSHFTASRGRAAWHARDISCVISIFQHYKHLQKFLIILAASSNDHDSKCGNTILSMSIIYISTFRVCQARKLSCGEPHWIDVCW